MSGARAGVSETFFLLPSLTAICAANVRREEGPRPLERARFFGSLLPRFRA